MLFFLSDLGFLGIVNMIIAFAVIILAIKNAIELFISKRKERLGGLENSINAILFWSGLMVVIGFLSSFWGATSVIISLVQANISDTIVILRAIANLLKLIVLSLSFFTVFAIVWFILRTRYKHLIEKSM